MRTLTKPQRALLERLRAERRVQVSGPELKAAVGLVRRDLAKLVIGGSGVAYQAPWWWEAVPVWYPHGVPTWPDWKNAKPGARVEMVGTGRTGTLRRVSAGRAGNSFVVIQWDNDAMGHPVEPGTGVTGRVVAPAFELRPLEA